MSEENLYEYDVIVKMKIRTKENLSEKIVADSVEIALWGVELTTLTNATITDLIIEGKKKLDDKDVPV